jgi:uncharacterized protein
VQRLPLFPLGTVLVPGLVMPLRVFEPRYLTLLEDLFARPEDERVFGVVAIRAGHEVGAGNVSALYDVGCTAVIREVTPLDDGTMQLTTSGAVRFRLHGIDDTDPSPYLVGMVTPLPEPEGEGVDVASLSRKVSSRFAAYRDQLGTAQIALPDSPQVLSYLVAAGMALEMADRQSLLEQPDTSGRLAAELSLLTRERVLFSELRAVPSSGLTHEVSAN